MTIERRDLRGTYIDERSQSAAVTGNNVKQLLEGQGCQQTAANVQAVQAQAAAVAAAQTSQSSGGQAK